jgi:beta-galactosidase
MSRALGEFLEGGERQSHGRKNFHARFSAHCGFLLRKLMIDPRRFSLIIALSSLVVLGGTSSSVTAQEISEAKNGNRDAGRVICNLNRDWKFLRQDISGAGAPGFDDASWQSVNIPHSFDIPYFMSNYYVGTGWYRKRFEIKPEWIGRRLYLEFDGAFQDAEVSVNGKSIGRHKGGFTGFIMDITDAVHAGENLLAVRLSNKRDYGIAPVHGDHTFMGGIYRNVRLVITDPVHVTWYGTWITTPSVSKESAVVKISTEVSNQSPVERTVSVSTVLLDPDGKIVAELSSPLTLKVGETATVTQTTKSLPSPKLWHPDHPFLYTAETVLTENGKNLDRFHTPFGIRWFEWTAEKGFFLNGEHYYFHGANAHQDHAGWGDAVTDNGVWRDVKLIKEAGFDFIRGSHYPHHPTFADACDQLGLLFWSENCFWDVRPSAPADATAFEQNLEETLRDEIRIFRNHPSIVVWSMCNEVFISGGKPEVKALLKKLVDDTHQLDPNRPAAIGGCQRGNLDKLGDIAGYNGDGARIAEFQNPGIPNVVSEYGSHISDRGDAKTDTYDGMFRKDELNESTPEYPWRSGQSLWCAFDYSTVYGHFGHMGMVDFFRVPKRAWYWYRNHFRHIPPPAWPVNGTPARLDLTADKTSISGTGGTDDVQIQVKVMDKEGRWLSNSPPVTLSVLSGPGEFPTGRSITFRPPSDGMKSDISIRDGIAAIEFRSYEGGESVIRASSPGLPDSSITITTSGEPRFVPGKTSLAPDRPYLVEEWLKDKTTPYGPGAPKQKPSTGENMALNHPSSASSESTGHLAKFANDGDKGTFWKAALPSPDAWWCVDTEGNTTFRAVILNLGTGGAFRYKIQTSDDLVGWKTVSDQSAFDSANMVRRYPLPEGSKGRYLRVLFTGLPAGVSARLNEVEIDGSR